MQNTQPINRCYLRPIFIIMIFSLSAPISAQDEIAWSQDYELELSDFQSPQSEINSELTSYSLFSGASVYFSFNMSSYEFMFAKHFNDKVRCIFNPKIAILYAPDSAKANELLEVARFTFDLNELYARKFRKRLYEEKGAFSDASFFHPLYDEILEEMNMVISEIAKQTDLGKDDQLLEQEHVKVLDEIEGLSDFCLDCKPPKKKRGK